MGELGGVVGWLAVVMPLWRYFTCGAVYGVGICTPDIVHLRTVHWRYTKLLLARVTSASSILIALYRISGLSIINFLITIHTQEPQALQSKPYISL